MPSRTPPQNFSDMLIERGIRPGMKKYASVRPRDFYMLLPSAWKQARQLEQATDMSYDILMNQYKIAEAKQRLSR